MYKIIGLDHQGRGITRIDNKVVFVEKALPGEVVDIEIYEEHKKYSLARIKEIIEPSRTRRIPMCKYYGTCGGCNLMHMKYEEQLQYKKEKVENIFKKYLNLDIEIPIISSNKETNYRNKITLHGDGKRQGFYKEKSNEIVYIDECLLAESSINECLPIESEEKEVILRSSNEEVISNIFEKSSLIKKIKDFKFKINVNSFFQINDYICEKLFDEILSFVKEDEVVLDLYSGVGTLSIVSAKKAKYVHSVEINKYAYKDILENIKLNKVKNVKAYCMAAEKFAKTFDKKFDSLILDPPRIGLDKFTTNFIIENEPGKILYISCDPLSLVRDLQTILEKYNIKEIKLMDMFPNTHHIETICYLEKK